jgi:electron transport complex protein RnfB
MAYTITSDCVGCLACKLICPSSAIYGEKEEGHLVNQDICIDCGACGKVCPVEAVVDNYGLTTTRVKRKKWKRPIVDMKTCMSCNICLDTCPTGALEERLKKKGSLHAFPTLPDESICMGCGFCASDCPVSAITMVSRQKSKFGFRLRK